MTETNVQHLMLRNHCGAKSFVFILQGMDGRAQNVLPISCMEEIVSGESLCEKVYINKHNWINWIVMMSWVETFSLKQMCSIMLRMSYKVSLGQRSFVFILQDMDGRAPDYTLMSGVYICILPGSSSHTWLLQRVIGESLCEKVYCDIIEFD